MECVFYISHATQHRKIIDMAKVKSSSTYTHTHKVHELSFRIYSDLYANLLKLHVQIYAK